MKKKLTLSTNKAFCTIREYLNIMIHEYLQEKNIFQLTKPMIGPT